MTAVICRVIGKEAEAKSTSSLTVYDDVPAEHWASGYINLATNEKIVGGDGNGKFRPEDDVKLEEAVKMIVCALGFADGAVSDPADWSKVYFDIAKDKEITKKILGSKGNPATRGDIAVMTYSGISAKENEKAEEIVKDSNFNANDNNVGSLPSGGGSSRPVSTPDADTFTVSFDLNYEGATDAPASQTINSGEKATMPENPDREGYAFVGWYIDNTFTALFDFSNTTITVDTTIYARWVDITDTTDTDGDGLTDPVEEYYGTDKAKADTDGDGLTDYIEATALSLNPLKKDSDDNGTEDGQEDTDADGIINKEEITNGTDPAAADTDGDGLSDKEETAYGTNPVEEDTDGDGVSDGKEIELGTDPLAEQETFSLNLSAIYTGSGAVASVQMDLPGEQVETLRVEPVNDNTFFPETMPGYMGQAYDFNVDGEFDNATISFEFDTSSLGEGAEPVIYYYNEDEQELEELPTTINGNVASTNVTHFSKYILVDRKVYREAFTWQDVWESDKNYTGVEIVLVIDDSGSMWGNDSNNLRLAVAQNLVDKLPNNSKIGIVNFQGYTTILTQELTNDKEAAKSYLTEEYFKSSGGTRMYSAIFESAELYESDDESIMKVMVVLTDGDTSDTSSHSAAITTMNELGIKVYTVGLGSSTSYFNSYLKPLSANTGAAFYLASNANQLESIYDNISEKIDIETDSDEDGIPDYYEDNMIIFSGVKLSLDKNKWDTDGDGIKDGDEVVIKKEPNENGTKVKVTGKLVLGNPTKADTDGDGVDDGDDDVPFVWNVCDRDLAICAALCYEDGTAASSEGRFYHMNEIKGNGEDETDESYYFYGLASSTELSSAWKIVDYYNDWTQAAHLDKFSATTYKNGNNIILAYRGTNDGLWEWADNILCYGLANYHAEESLARQYASYIAKSYPNCNLYITGHSLGGYLAQIGTAEILKNHSNINLVKTAYFNGIGMKYNKLLFWTKNEEMDLLKEFNNETNSLISYHINGDWVSMLGTHCGEEKGFEACDEAVQHHINKYYGEYGNMGFWESVGKILLDSGVTTLGSGIAAVAASPTVLYYYVHYNSPTFITYSWITHETDSFFKYLKRNGTSTPGAGHGGGGGGSF